MLYKSLKSTHAFLKKCSYFIKYQFENSFFFGLIEYYIQIERRIYAVLIRIKVFERDFNINATGFEDIFDLQNEPIFYKGTILSKKVIIDVNSIIRKCIFIKSVDGSEIYFSDFISEIDHN